MLLGASVELQRTSFRAGYRPWQLRRFFAVHRPGPAFGHEASRSDITPDQIEDPSRHDPDRESLSLPRSRLGKACNPGRKHWHEPNTKMQCDNHMPPTVVVRASILAPGSLLRSRGKSWPVAGPPHEARAQGNLCCHGAGNGVDLDVGVIIVTEWWCKSSRNKLHPMTRDKRVFGWFIGRS